MLNITPKHETGGCLMRVGAEEKSGHSGFIAGRRAGVVGSSKVVGSRIVEVVERG